MDRQHNRHHIIFPRKLYQRGDAKVFRESAKLIVNMPINDHSELHASVKANVIVPSREILVASLGQIAFLNGAPPLEVVGELSSWFKSQAQPDIARNLFKQTRFLGRAQFGNGSGNYSPQLDSPNLDIINN